MEMLQAEEHDQIERAAARGDPAAANRLFMAYLPLVRTESRKFYSTHLQQSDLYQAGCIGLLRAVRTFNPDLGWRFITYADRVIRNEILRELHANRFGQGVGNHTHQSIRTAIERRTSLGQPMPSDEEISAETRIPIAMIRMARVARNAERGKFIEYNDETVPADESASATEIRVLVADELRELEAFRLEVFRVLERHMKPRLQSVMRMRFGLDGAEEPMTFHAIGKALGITKQWVEQLEKKGLRTLAINLKHFRRSDSNQSIGWTPEELREQLSRIHHIPHLRRALDVDLSRPIADA